MRLLALDLALNTGWAWGENLARAYAGVWRLPGYSERDLPRTLGGIYSAVLTVCRSNEIEAVQIEAALRGVKRTNKRGITTPTSAWGDRCLTMLNGAAQAAVANSGAKLLKPVGPSTWRKSVLGEAFPANPKEAAVRYCALQGREIPDHDAAEAFCILQHALGNQNLLDRIKS